jgi:hypothetical protein
MPLGPTRCPATESHSCSPLCRTKCWRVWQLCVPCGRRPFGQRQFGQRQLRPALSVRCSPPHIIIRCQRHLSHASKRRGALVPLCQVLLTPVAASLAVAPPARSDANLVDAERPGAEAPSGDIQGRRRRLGHKCVVFSGRKSVPQPLLQPRPHIRVRRGGPARPPPLTRRVSCAPQLSHGAPRACS